MSLQYFRDLEQGSPAWLQARCGLLTTSEMKLIITPTLKAASNEKERGHLYALLAQRITKFVEPSYISDDMLRGINDEAEAIALYAKHYAPVERIGFMTNDKWGFTIGYSPDGLVGTDGQVECKSRNQKYQVKTLIDYVSCDTIDPDFVIQSQTGLLVSGRDWCDQISYCGGMPMATVRVYPDDKVQAAIIDAATAFEERLNSAWGKFNALMLSSKRLIPTERRVEVEMYDGRHGELSAFELNGGIPL